jgi:23S rRNA (cytidine1920-2'-O)/16S rRNA (cytidine1409-2'-O)-methyltransferase
MAVQRLDQALVASGLVESRTKARRQIESGNIVVAGVVATKPAMRVGPDDVITVTSEDPYVGRGAHKLQAALTAWNLDVSGATAVDLGASTGGFTQVLLEAGADHVVAIDVGHNQLHTNLLNNPRVTLCEGVNARYVSSQWWDSIRGGTVDWVVADLSFISLSKIFGPVTTALGPASWVCLIKPQFEVGRSLVSEGIAGDQDSHEKAITAVLESAEKFGLHPAGLMHSPITGEAGNKEYLCWLRHTPGGNQTQWSQRIHELTHS